MKPSPAKIEAAARRIAAVEDLHWDSVCAYEADPDAPSCAVPDCVGNWLDAHDPAEARAYYRTLAVAALGDGK